MLPLDTTYLNGPTCNRPSSGYNSGSRTVWWNGAIPAAAALTCIYTVTVDAGLADGTVITNTALATVGPHLLWTNVVSTLIQAPAFAITKQASADPVAGALLTYTLTAHNTGSGAGTSVVITDAVPIGAYYVSGGSYSGGVVTWSGLTVPAGGAVEATFVVTACQGIVNSLYRVAGSDQGIVSPWGAALATSFSAPTIGVDLALAPVDVLVGQTVYFSGSATTDGSPIAGWAWTLGDGGTGSGQNTSHAYSAAGSYTVTLAVTDGCGYSAQKVVANAVHVHEPVLTIGKAASTAVAGAPFTFTLAVTNSDVLAAATGVVITDAVPIGAYYVSGGSYSDGVVTWSGLTVPAGGSVEATFVVTACQQVENNLYRVAGSDQGVISPWGAPVPVAPSAPAIAPDFTWTPLEPDDTDVVTFTGTASTDGGPVVAWAWDFGDGGTAGGAVVEHTFAAGTYTVTLTVTDTCGFRATVEKRVTVASSCEPVTADFGWQPPEVRVHRPVTFTVVLSGGTPPITYTWRWGDGSPDTVTRLLSVQHTFARSGEFTVTLLAENDCTSGPVAVHRVIVRSYLLYLPLVMRGWP